MFGQRVTIERAFGMLVRRWGILWKPLEHDVATNKLICRICAKLIIYASRNSLKLEHLMGRFRLEEAMRSSM